MKHLNQINWSKKSSPTGVIISAADAINVLDNHNSVNRYLRAGGANYIAKQILSGEWIKDHPQPICFSNDGDLLDGQHRLAGIVISKRTVVANVMFGVNREYMKYMDTGISRILSDRVRFHENNFRNKFIGSMINIVQVVGAQCPLYNEMNRMSLKLTPSEALAMFYTQEASFTGISEIYKSQRYLGSAAVGLAFADYHKLYGIEAFHMYSDLFDPLTNNHSARMLRNFILTSGRRGNTLYPFCVSACLANHEGRQIKTIRSASWR